MYRPWKKLLLGSTELEEGIQLLPYIVIMVLPYGGINLQYAPQLAMLACLKASL
jgi:hypothetical protein